MRKKCLEDANNGTLIKQFQAYDHGSGRVNKEDLTAILGNIIYLSDFFNFIFNFIIFLLDSYNLLGNGDKDITEHEILTIMRGSGNKMPTFDYVILIEQMISPTDYYA
jgi:hypothetical protein